MRGALTAVLILLVVAVLTGMGSLGGHQPLKVNKSVVFYGDTGYGAHQITAGDVSRIVFPK